MNDTSPEIPKKIFDKYMSLSGFERLQIGSSMFESAKKMQSILYRKTYPN